MAKPERRWWSNPPVIARYGVAVVSVIAALVCARWMAMYLVGSPVSLFLCAVMLSAWFGGLKPGLLATALSVLAFKYYVAAPAFSLSLDIKQIPRLLIFALAALFVGLLSAAQRIATESLRQRRAGRSSSTTARAFAPSLSDPGRRTTASGERTSRPDGPGADGGENRLAGRAAARGAHRHRTTAG